MKLKSILEQNSFEFGTINEASLSRLVTKVQSNDFAIVTAFRGSNTLQQNRNLNKRIFSQLQQRKMGGYTLIGVWQEVPDGVEWKNSEESERTAVQEESVLFIRPETMSVEEFITFAVGLAKEFNQDAVLLGLQGEGIFLYFKNGNRQKIGDGITIDKIGQAYSKLRGGNPTPFIFEGALFPDTIFGKMLFKTSNMKYI